MTRVYSMHDLKVLLVRFLIKQSGVKNVDRCLHDNLQRPLVVKKKPLPDSDKYNFYFFVLDGTPPRGYAAYVPVEAKIVLMTPDVKEGPRCTINRATVLVEDKYNGFGVFAKND